MYIHTYCETRAPCSLVARDHPYQDPPAGLGVANVGLRVEGLGPGSGGKRGLAAATSSPPMPGKRNASRT